MSLLPPADGRSQREKTKVGGQDEIPPAGLCHPDAAGPCAPLGAASGQVDSLCIRDAAGASVEKGDV